MPEKKNFWITLPGIITGIAAVFTALTGLVVALNGFGLARESPILKPQIETRQVATKDLDVLPIKNVVPDLVKSDESKQPAVMLKAVFSMTEITLEDQQYKILSSSFNAITPENNSFEIEIKCKNNSHYGPSNFWNESFRLSIDGLLTAPTGDLNELVDRHAELIGKVKFDVPVGSKELIFHILNNEKDVAIPIKLTPA